MRTIALIIVFALSLFSFSLERDFNTPEGALQSLYPGASVEVKNYILSREQQEKAKKIAKVPVDSRLVSFYLVKKEGKTVAYGYVDIHKVRTHPETVLFVINPQGKIEVIEILSFNEPLEYMADENWLALFKGKSLDNSPLRVNRDIPNMTGATLTARAITKASRRALALWKVLFEEGNR